MKQGAGFEMLCLQLKSVRPGSTDRMIVITGSLESTLPVGLVPTVLCKPFGNRQLQLAIAQLIAL